MKNLISIITVFVMVHPLFSMDDTEYEKAMMAAMEKMGQVQTQNDFLDLANRFERIAEVKKDRWEPLYHAAYARVMMAAMEQDPEKKDPHLDVAQSYLKTMESIEYDQVEKLALEGFLIMIRMSVDPSRGMEMGQQCGMTLNQAYAMDNNNPRAVLMLAQFKFGSASYMGMDTSEPCAMFDRSIELFDSEAEENSEPFAPRWGKEMAVMMKQQCK